jgi:hypothetical protein
MEKLSGKSKFNYYQFFKWLAIGFTVASVGILIAIILALYTKTIR